MLICFEMKPFLHPLLGLLFICVCFSFKPGKPKCRLIVLTDITSLTAGYKEPDDGQSLIRLMLYSNELDIEGLIASSNLGHGQTIRPDLIKQVVNAYGEVRGNLLQHAKGFPSREALLSVVKNGNPNAGRNIPLLLNIGEGKDTEASDWIIKVVDKKDDRPVWISIWGGATDLAQALWKVKHTRDAGHVQQFIRKIRVWSIADQDAAGPWIREEFPNLYYILQKVSMRGMHRGGDTSVVREEWVRKYIKGKGALGELYPIYNGGDIWVRNAGPLKGIKEGDTPAFLALLPIGLNDNINPEWTSWGGRFVREGNGNLFTDAVDSIGDFANDLHPTLATVYRWRNDFQADFASRMDWCVQSYEKANHPPQPSVKVRKTKEGWLLDASGSTDPDRQELTFNWWIDKQASIYKGNVSLSDHHTAKVLAPMMKGLHVVVAVKDNGQPALTRYKRIILD